MYVQSPLNSQQQLQQGVFFINCIFKGPQAKAIHKSFNQLQQEETALSKSSQKMVVVSILENKTNVETCCNFCNLEGDNMEQERNVSTIFLPFSTKTDIFRAIVAFFS